MKEIQHEIKLQKLVIENSVTNTKLYLNTVTAKINPLVNNYCKIIKDLNKNLIKAKMLYYILNPARPQLCFPSIFEI